jgi:hypothetical protein
LLNYESLWVYKLNSVNKNTPSGWLIAKSKPLKKQYNKQYYEDNKENLKEKKKINDKQYYDNNKEKKKQYYEDNKQLKKQYHKQYYEKNKDKAKQYNKEKITCECGYVMNRSSLSKHKLTKKHNNKMNIKSND